MKLNTHAPKQILHKESSHSSSKEIFSELFLQLQRAQEIYLLLIRLIFQSFQLRRWRRKEILEQISRVGIGSLPIIAIATTFAGLVVTTEMAWHMDRALHTVDMIPGFTGQFILRELGIAIPSLLLVSKVGAAMTAEIGSMKVTEQLDALRLLRIDLVEYLIFPRFLATVFSCVCLVLIASAVTLICATWVAVNQYHFGLGEYLNGLRALIVLSDLFCAVTKGIVFGALIPVISCVYGMNCKPGAEGVGEATTQSVVASTLAVIGFDFVLTFLFTQTS